MRSLRTLVVMSLASIALVSCTAMRERFLRPLQEDPIDNSDSYLARTGGPRSTVDLGAGEEQLLTRFQELLEQKNSLEQRQKELEGEVVTLESTLATEQKGHATESRLRAGAEAEVQRLRRLKSDREVKVLHLQIQIADLERKNLELEIARLESELETLTPRADNPATPAGGDR